MTTSATLLVTDVGDGTLRIDISYNPEEIAKETAPENYPPSWKLVSAMQEWMLTMIEPIKGDQNAND